MTLFDELKTNTFTENQVAFILYEILKGLKQIHDLGYIHLDIKPENILLF